MEQFMMMLAECTLTMTIAALGLFAATPLLKNVNPKGMYIAWIVIVIGFLIPYRPHFIPPVFEITIRQPSPTGAADTSALAGASGEGASAVATYSSGSAAVPQPSALQIVFIIWLVGAAALLVYHLVKHRQFVRVVKRWSKPITDTGILDAFAQAKVELGIDKNIGLLFCEPVDSPMLLGIAKHKILLPDLELTVDELAIVFRHELIHFKRKDLLTKVLMLAANTLHWFNPIIYFVSKALSFYSESSCDFEATKNENMDEKRYYSETIISVIRRQSKMKTALSTSFYGGKNGMKRRILSVMNTTKKRAGLIAVCISLVLVFATGTVFAVDLPPAGTIDTMGKNDAYKVLVEISELDYEDMTVAGFAGEVETISEKAGTDIFSLMSEADIDYENTDPLYPFATGVLSHTSQELFSSAIGGEETPYMTGYVEKLRAHDIMSDKGTMSDEEFEAFLEDVQKFEDAGFDTTVYDFQAYFTYTFLYDIPNPNVITVGEREGKIAYIKKDFQAYVDGLSEDDLVATGAKADMIAKLKQLAKKYSDNKISFEYHDFRFELFDGENEMFG